MSGGVVVLVGNPRRPSRTAALALDAARRIARHDEIGGEVTVVELADLAAGLLPGPSRAADDARRVAASAELLVVATPVYKGAYTGLLKVFLDGFGPAALDGVRAVPVVVAAGHGHLTAGDRFLAPVLEELGASVAPALTVLEADLPASGYIIEGWLASGALARRELVR
ncbi:NADPH-dependent FMN reductase [Cellulomonas sp. PhB143]|uniref:NADPH-dependent FMN reductase n=1 Tax=Cellulomonas sp. PhB143 TaxID=2485186 RepID=UPI000F4ADC67|nr:NAD(P)H-dependent oxidoreductase [Cellulomonas sp. PhB143]ROS75441.1 FMN reductase [Cellulomonas sp. PhB143]